MTNFDSYPPLFLPDNGVGYGGESPKPCPDSDSLPVIDLEDMSPEKLGEVCREWGVFRLANHGVPAELLSQLHEHANKLFCLSFESKQALPTSPILYFWGTSALAMSENAPLRADCLQKLNWLEGLCSPVAQVS